MNQNIAYFSSSSNNNNSNNIDHRQSNNVGQNPLPFQHAGSSVEFHPVSGGGSGGFHSNSNSGNFHPNGGGSFVSLYNFKALYRA
jgi:hypothetical protein